MSSLSGYLNGFCLVHGRPVFKKLSFFNGIKARLIKSRYGFVVVQTLLIFPSMLLFTVCLLFSPAFSMSESDKKESQIKKLETDLSKEREKLLKFEFKEKNLLEQLSSIEEAVEEKNRLIKGLREKIHFRRKELEIQQKRLKRLEQDLIQTEKRLTNRMVAFYKYAKRGYVQILATSNDLTQLRKKMRYLKLIMDEDRSILREMADEQLKYKRELSSIKEKLADIDEMEKTQNKQLQAVKMSMEKKVILLAKIHQEKEFYETVVKELQQAAYKLKETILDLDKKPKKRAMLPTGFETSKGRLPLPFIGKIIKDKSQVGEKTLHVRKGIYIEGPLGSEIKAVFPGRVDFSGQLKGYGQVIVINHGSRFFTISAHLLQRNKEEGDMVETGDVIGLLGQSGSLSGPRLYFEIREAGKNRDPIKWLKVN